MLKQNQKDPIFVVRLQMPRSCSCTERGEVLAVTEYEPEQETTVHAKDEQTATKYIMQQNPWSKVSSAELLKKP